MKRILILIMAVVVVIGAANPAWAAVEFKTSGHMHLLLGVKDNGLDTGFNKDVPEDNFFAAQRLRPKLTIRADGVTAVFEPQQHQAYWGSDWPVGGNPNVSIRIRQAYIDFKLPGTPVSLKVGYQQLSLPSIWGNPVFDARVGGVVATIPFNDQMALSAFWIRPADKLSTTGHTGGTAANPTGPTTFEADPRHNATDVFGAMLPLNFGAVKIAPYLAYGRVGAGTLVNNRTPAVAVDFANDTLIAGGANLAIAPTDALSVKVDAIVTNYSSDEAPKNGGRDYGTGWMLASALDYELPWGTPGLFAWYATGEDEDGEGGLYVLKTGGVGPTTWGYEGYNTFELGAQIGTSCRSTAAIGAQIADLSFIDSLKHTVRLAYIMGTGHKDNGGNWDAWTTKDSFIEVNFDSDWSIYENLAAVVEIGALVPDFGSKTKENGFEDDLAVRAEVTLRFTF